MSETETLDFVEKALMADLIDSKTEDVKKDNIVLQTAIWDSDIAEGNIEVLQEKYPKLCKVNLPTSEEGYESGNGEGVWGVACNEDSFNKINDEGSNGDIVYIALLNQPVCHQDVNWGDIVVAKTRGEYRPTAEIGGSDE